MSNIDLDQKSAERIAELITDITAEREKQGLSQSKLSNLAGIKQSALSRMESLKAFPQLDTLYKILSPLNLKLTLKQINNNEENSMKITNNMVKKLIVDTHICNLNVTTSVDNDFHMVTANEDNFTLEKTEDSIIIKQKKRKGIKWLLSWIPVEIKVTVPQGFDGETRLTNDNGKTKIYSINLGSLKASNDNGGIDCEDIKAGEVFLSADNGSIKVQGANFASFDGHAGNGSIKLEDLNSNDCIKAKTSNGSITAKNVFGKHFDFKSSNGSVILDKSDCESLSATTSNGRVNASLLSNEADYAIDFSTSNGGIYLGNKKTSGRYVVKSDGKPLQAHTANGSIRFSFADTIIEDDIGADADEPIEISEEEIEVIPKE